MSGTEVAIELEPIKSYDDDDDKSKKPLLPLSLPKPSSLNNANKRLGRKDVIIIAAVVGFYWVCSMSVVFLNKYIFSYADFEFPYPLFVTW